MRTGTIVKVLVAGALIGWFAPDLSRAGRTDADGALQDGGGKQPSALAMSTERQSRKEAWLTGATVLDRQPDGHFYADVTVDARPYRFLVDTGASMIALTGDDASAMGLDWDDGDLRPIGRGASGTVYGVPVMLDRVELGGFEAQNIEAAIIPDGLDVSLLGQSFLSRLRGVQIDGDRMTLGASD